MDKPLTILELEKRIAQTKLEIDFKLMVLKHSKKGTFGYVSWIKEIEFYKQKLQAEKELLELKSRCCGKCGGGFFEDGSVDGLCGGDECLPIKATDIRWCFVPKKGKDQEDEPLF